MPEATHQALFSVYPHEKPFRLFVIPIDEFYAPDKPVKEFHEDFFTPEYAVMLEDYLRTQGWVVVSPWADEIEWRVAKLVALNA